MSVDGHHRPRFQGIEHPLAAVGREFRRSKFIRSRGEALAWALKESRISLLIIIVNAYSCLFRQTKDGKITDIDSLHELFSSGKKQVLYVLMIQRHLYTIWVQYRFICDNDKLLTTSCQRDIKMFRVFYVLSIQYDHSIKLKALSQ